MHGRVGSVRHRIAIGWFLYLVSAWRHWSRSVVNPRLPRPAGVHCIPERLPRLERGRLRRRYRSCLAGPGVAPGAGRPGPGTERPESLDPHFVAIYKSLADRREHAVHRAPCGGLVHLFSPRPRDAAILSAAGASPVFGRHYHKFPPARDAQPAEFCHPVMVANRNGARTARLPVRRHGPWLPLRDPELADCDRLARPLALQLTPAPDRPARRARVVAAQPFLAQHDASALLPPDGPDSIS